MVTPTSPVLPPESARAFRFVLNPWSRTTRSTASRVSGATSGRPLSTRETVAIDTPAALATSRIVALGLDELVDAIGAPIQPHLPEPFTVNRRRSLRER